MDKLIKNIFFNSWKSLVDVDLQKEFYDIQHREIEPHSFTFYTSVSVMSSSRIEGEVMEIDSYVKHKMLNIEYLPELIEKPNDLYNAYLFAKENKLNKKSFLQAHQLVSAHLLPENQRGTIRKTEMLVMEHKTGRIQYEAAPLAIVENEFNNFWEEMESLFKQKLAIDEIFYYAAFIHLVFVKIHPFSDGNGRMARLLEKWFIAEKLGERAWHIQSEKYYHHHVNDYYKNLGNLGLFYSTLDYQKCLDFLLMLPKALTMDGH